VAHELEPLMSVDVAQDRVRAASGEPLPGVDITLDEALGRVLAEPLRSALDLPPWDNSSMDGFAVHADDVAGATPSAPVRLRIVGEVRAGGSPDLEVPAGCAVRIATGARVPASTDAVVPVESTVVVGTAGGLSPGLGGALGAATAPRTAGFRAAEPVPEACLVTAAVARGEFIRRQGEDVRAGATVLEPGQRIGPAQIAMAAAVGAGVIHVHRRPVAGVLSTGDELRSAGHELGESGIPDANRPGLLAMCRGAGAETIDLGIAADSLESVLGVLRPAMERLDVLIVSGGVSVGPYDVVRSAFDAIGRVDLWRVAVQPGKPFAFGRSDPRPRDGRQVLLFGLPGNPVSALVTFELFVKPALQRTSGLMSPTLDSDRAVTEDRLAKAPGRRGFLRVSVARDERGSPVRDDRGRLRVRHAGGQGSHMLSAMAAADALAVVPEAVDRIEPGGEVEIRWLRI
jgi:molybdopterin molybdotransferase